MPAGVSPQRHNGDRISGLLPNGGFPVFWPLLGLGGAVEPIYRMPRFLNLGETGVVRSTSDLLDPTSPSWSQEGTKLLCWSLSH